MARCSGESRHRVGCVEVSQGTSILDYRWRRPARCAAPRARMEMARARLGNLSNDKQVPRQITAIFHLSPNQLTARAYPDPDQHHQRIVAPHEQLTLLVYIPGIGIRLTHYAFNAASDITSSATTLRTARSFALLISPIYFSQHLHGILQQPCFLMNFLFSI